MGVGIGMGEHHQTPQIAHGLRGSAAERETIALQLQQPWGIPFIIASLATVFVVAEGFCAAVAQLATGSRLGAARDARRAAQDAAGAEDVDAVGRRPWREHARQKA
jgi:hypothetical protein